MSRVEAHIREIVRDEVTRTLHEEVPRVLKDAVEGAFEHGFRSGKRAIPTEMVSYRRGYQAGHKAASR